MSGRKLKWWLVLCLAAGLPAVAGAQSKKMKKSPDKKAPAVKYDRLPPNVTPETEVVGAPKKIGGQTVTEPTTAERRLRELGARYRRNVLVDAKGREIRFFEPLCRGVSAGFEEDAAAAREKDREYAELRKKYTVVVIYCNPANVF